VTAVTVPSVDDGGSRAVDGQAVTGAAADHDVVATAGVEALAASRAAGLSTDVRFGTPSAVKEAAMKGLDVLLLVTPGRLSDHTEPLREQNLTYEVLDLVE
jgi:putative transcriptional regulator